jgi:peptidoglycan hydrolase CwlO-like protein
LLKANKKDLKKINSDVKSITNDMDDINKFIKETEGKAEKVSLVSKEGKGQCK